MKMLLVMSLATSTALVGGGGVGAQSAPGSDGTVLAVALASSLVDVGVGAGLVAGGVADALVVADSPESLGDGAAGVVREALPGRVVLVGGTAVLGPEVEAELGVLLPGVTIERVWGATRVDTAAAAARRTLAGSSERPVVALANGWSLADVGAAVGLVASGGADAVLYADVDGLGEQTAAVLGEVSPRRLVVVGGPAALSEQVRADAKAAAGAGTPSRRLGGASRTHTAALTARAGAGECVAAALVANGWSDADVGTAVSLGAAWGQSIVLYAESADELGDAARTAIADLGPQSITLVGDTDALSQELRDQLPAGRSARRVTDAHQAARLALGTPPRDCQGTGGGRGGGGATSRGASGTRSTPQGTSNDGNDPNDGNDGNDGNDPNDGNDGNDGNDPNDGNDGNDPNDGNDGNDGNTLTTDDGNTLTTDDGNTLTTDDGNTLTTDDGDPLTTAQSHTTTHVTDVEVLFTRTAYTVHEWHKEVLVGLRQFKRSNSPGSITLPIKVELLGGLKASHLDAPDWIKIMAEKSVTIRSHLTEFPISLRDGDIHYPRRRMVLTLDQDSSDWPDNVAKPRDTVRGTIGETVTVKFEDDKSFYYQPITVQFAESSYSATEGGTDATVTVKLSHPWDDAAMPGRNVELRMEVSRNLGAHNDDFYFLHAGTESECGTKAAGYKSGISCAVQLPQTDIFDSDCDGDRTDFVLVGTGPDCGSGSRLCRVVEDTLNKDEACLLLVNTVQEDFYKPEVDGETMWTFKVQAWDDGDDDDNESITLRLDSSQLPRGFSVGTRSSTTITFVDND